MKAHELFKVIVASLGLYAIYEGFSFLLRGALYAAGLYQVPSNIPVYYISRGVIEILLALMLMKLAPIVVNFVFPGCYKQNKE